MYVMPISACVYGCARARVCDCACAYRLLGIFWISLATTVCRTGHTLTLDAASLECHGPVEDDRWQSEQIQEDREMTYGRTFK